MCLVNFCHFSDALLRTVRIEVWFCAVLMLSISHQDYSSEFASMNELLVICSHKLHVLLSSFCGCWCFTVVVLRENFLLAQVHFYFWKKKSLGSEQIVAFRCKV